MEERRLGVFENRVLRRVFGPKRGGDRRKLKGFMICTLHQVLLEYLRRG
jgi:hypothetical protein